MNTEKQTTESPAQTATEASVLDHPLVSAYTSSHSASRAIAIAAGDYRLAVTREVNRILNENHQHPLQATKVGLERLTASRLISVQERRSLEQVCSTVFSSLRGDINPSDGLTQVREIYEQMLIDEATSPVALAIASVAASAFQSSTPSNANPQESAVSAAASNRGDFGMVAGSIVGAGIGGAIGGIGGAIIGGVVGGIAGGVAGACSA